MARHHHESVLATQVTGNRRIALFRATVAGTLAIVSHYTDLPAHNDCRFDVQINSASIFSDVLSDMSLIADGDVNVEHDISALAVTVVRGDEVLLIALPQGSFPSIGGKLYSILTVDDGLGSGTGSVDSVNSGEGVSVDNSDSDNPIINAVHQALGFALSDRDTPIVAGVVLGPCHLPGPFKVYGVRISLEVASSAAGPFTVDVKKNGSSIFSTLVTIDDTETSSNTASTAAVLIGSVPVTFADDNTVTWEVTDEGTGAKGLIGWLIGSYV